MTELEFAAISALQFVTYLPGSWDKRFVRDMASKPRDYELSEKQRDCLLEKLHRYRRQIKNWQGFYNPLKEKIQFRRKGLAVLGGTTGQPQPQPTDAVLGGQHGISN